MAGATAIARTSAALAGAAVLICAIAAASPAVAAPPQISQSWRAQSRTGLFDPLTSHRWQPPENREREVGPATVSVGAEPVGVTIDHATHTAYVANTGDNTVSVFSTATCNAGDPTGCDAPTPTIAVGSVPLSLVVDDGTHTLYVADAGDNTVSVIDTATCNATDAGGCARTPAMISVGSSPGVLALDPTTHTVYVPNAEDGNVSVIDGVTCNATDISGCGDVPPTVAAGPGAGVAGFDQENHTLYVANFDADGTVSVIDTAGCNAGNTTNCAQTPSTVHVGPFPDNPIVDAGTDTVYVPTAGSATGDSLGRVSMINARTCNGGDSSGCARTPPTAPIGSAPVWADADPANNTVYVANQEDSNVTPIDTKRCNADTTLGCRTAPPAIAAAFNPGAIAIDASTGTLYEASQNNDTVSVLSADRCDGTTSSGCTAYAPTTQVGLGPEPVALDASTDTVYVGNSQADTISVLDATRCGAHHQSSCREQWPTVAAGSGPFYGLVVDPSSSTVYATNVNDNTLSVIDARTCNARVHGGCRSAPITAPVAPAPSGLAVDDHTHTLYLASRVDDTLSVIDTATCDRHAASDCDAVATVATGSAPLAVAINPATNTIYVANLDDHTVSVIDGRTCNATVTTGCAHPPATVNVADSPFSLAVNPATNTVYVANTGEEQFQLGQSDLTSSVSVIDGTRCDSSDTSGCASAIASVPTGGFPWGVSIDPATNKIYVTSIVDSTIEVIDGNGCDSGHLSHCLARTMPLRTGGWPAYTAVDDRTGTLYVADNVDGAMSLLPLER